MNRNDRVFVTQPYLPPLQEFIPYLEKIWNSKVLTNCGPFHERLERAFASVDRSAFPTSCARCDF